MSDKDIIYLDYAATTPLDNRVMEAMQPYFTQEFGNPSSIHIFGQKADVALETARTQVAELLNAVPGEIVFTSCGTESDNLALRGVCFAQRTRNGANHILISPVEHHAILRTAQQLEKYHGFELELLPVDRYGMIKVEDVANRLRPTTALVSIIYANNEIGAINPISEIGALCRSRAVPMHTDAVQAAAYLNLDVNELHVDLLSIGAHKFYGPKGVGALYIKKGTPIQAVQTGGGQESGMRAGTQNVPYIVGLAEALKLCRQERIQTSKALISMRDVLIKNVLEHVTDSQLTGHPHNRLPNHASFVFKGVDGNSLLMLLDVAGFACSSGSACKTGNPEPSEVLLSLGFFPEWALGSLRVTLGKATQMDDIIRLVEILPALVTRARQV